MSWNFDRYLLKVGAHEKSYRTFVGNAIYVSVLGLIDPRVIYWLWVLLVSNFFIYINEYLVLKKKMVFRSRRMEWVWHVYVYASGIMARSAGISTFCPCSVIYYSASIYDNGWNINPPLHTCNKKIVSWVDSSWWKPSKATKNSPVGS